MIVHRLNSSDDVGKIRLFSLPQRCWNTYAYGIKILHSRQGLSGLDPFLGYKGEEGLAGHVKDIRDSGIDGVDSLPVDVDASDLESLFGHFNDQGEPHVSQPDDPDSRRAVPDLFFQFFSRLPKLWP